MDLTFKDRKNRTWDLSIDMAAAMRIDESDYSALTDIKFSFLRPNQDLFMEIHTSTKMLFAMMWAVVYPQAEDQYQTYVSMTPEQQRSNQNGPNALFPVSTEQLPEPPSEPTSRRPSPADTEPTNEPTTGSTARSKRQSDRPIPTAQDIAQAEFMSGFNGSTIKKAKEQFWKALGDFFPEHQSVLSASLMQIERAHQKLTDRMGEMNPLIEERLDREIEKTLEQAKAELMSDVLLGTT